MDGAPGDYDGKHPTTIATDDATKAQKDAALVGVALACVGPDESVDLGRLLLVEYAHNFGLFQGVVAKAGTRIDKYKQDPSYEDNPDMREMNLYIFCKTKKPAGATSITIARHDDALWSVRPDDRRMTDAEMAAWMAVCARHCSFSFVYDAYIKGSEQQYRERRGYIDYEGMPCFKHMWLASVARGLAGRTGAWTRTEAVRTRALCVALAAILDARIEDGPLAVVGTPKSGRLDQSVVPSPGTHQEDDQRWLTSMRGALAQVRHVERVGFAFVRGYVGHRGPNAIDATDHARMLLYTAYRMVGRLYATEPHFVALTDPADREAVIAGAPLAATFWH